MNRNSFVRYRAPIESNMDAGLLPNPWEEDFTVPRASRWAWIKAIIILAIGFTVAMAAFGAFS